MSFPEIGPIHDPQFVNYFLSFKFSFLAEFSRNPSGSSNLDGWKIALSRCKMWHQQFFDVKPFKMKPVSAVG